LTNNLLEYAYSILLWSSINNVCAREYHEFRTKYTIILLHSINKRSDDCYWL